MYVYKEEIKGEEVRRRDVYESIDGV